MTTTPSQIARHWRARLAHHYTQWESRLLQPTGHLALSRMLVPFRLSAPGQAPGPVSPSVLAQDRCVVIGVAGCGKSTFAKWLAGQLISSPDTLPVVLRLRDLGAALQDASVDQALERFLMRLIPQAEPGFLDPLLRDPASPRVLLILDGWDQLGKRAAELRGLLMGLLQSYPRLGLVLTSRPGAPALPGPDEDMLVLHLELLSDPGVATLTRRVMEVLDPELPEHAAPEFLAQLRDHPHASALARRPLLLQMLLMHHPEPLPRSSAQLYRACIDALLQERAPTQSRHLEIQALAYRLQQARVQGVLQSHLPQEWPLARRRSFLEWAERDSGLVEKRGGSLVFIHSSIREYLAAAHLLSVADTSHYLELAHERSWAPVLVLWAGLMDTEQRGSLAASIAEAARGAHWALWLRLHALCLDAELPALPRPTRSQPTGAFLAAINGSCESEQCVATGRVLSSGSPLWPGSPWQLALLGAWPNRRVGVSRRLQQLALLGACTEQLRDAAQAPLRSQDTDTWKSALDQAWSGFLDDHGTYHAAQSWAWSAAMGAPDRLPAFLPQHSWDTLARTETPAHWGGAVALMRQACRAKLGLDHELERVLEQPQEDPLWRALALHLAGRSTPADRDLLRELALHPEQRLPPLRWGLRWIVRGDVLLLDGRVLQLEELGVELELLE